MPFYGNITNKRNQFSYDKVYSNKKSLLQAISHENSEQINMQNINTYNKITVEKDSDGVFIGRYVLIDYGQQSGNDKTAIGSQHAENYRIDNEEITDTNLQRSWDSTVWQKVYVDGILSYILIAELNAKEPSIIFHRYSPSYRDDNNQKVPFSLEKIDGKENSFEIKFQDAYDLLVSVPDIGGGTITYPNANESQQDIINAKGFDPTKRNYVESADFLNGGLPTFSIISEESGNEYADTKGPSADTLKFDIDLRSLGNFACAFYDILFSENRDIIVNCKPKSETEQFPNKDIYKLSESNGDLKKLYKVNNIYYKVKISYILENNKEKEQRTWEEVLDLSKKVSESKQSFASLFELIFKLYDLNEVLEQKGDIISETQMNIILSYFDTKFDKPNWVYQLGEIMGLEYKSYDSENQTHIMQLTGTIDYVTGILSASVKFGENYFSNDVIKILDSNGNALKDKGGNDMIYQLYMTNGTLATTGAWAKNTIGLINFDLSGLNTEDREDNAAYIYSAVPVWA